MTDEEDRAELRLMVSDLAIIVSYLAQELHRHRLLSPGAVGPIADAMSQIAGGLEPDDPDEHYELGEAAVVLNSVVQLLRLVPPGSPP